MTVSILSLLLKEFSKCGRLVSDVPLTFQTTAEAVECLHRNTASVPLVTLSEMGKSMNTVHTFSNLNAYTQNK